MKNILKVATVLLAVVFLSSCSRGGSGCPYELSATADLIFHIMK